MRLFVMFRAKLLTLYLPFCKLSVIRHILANQVLRCWADGGFEKSKKVLFLVSPSSLATQLYRHTVRDD